MSIKLILDLMRKPGLVFTSIVAVGTLICAPEAAALPNDWHCTPYLDQRPRHVPKGELSVLANVKKKIAPKPKRSTYKLQMVKIKPGRFTMGSPSNEAKREGKEGPEQTVSIDYAFEIGKYEVTFNDWNTCVFGGGCKGYKPDDSEWGKGKRPVINVSFNDAQNYLKWLNKVTGLKYRLPSEAEWEYAARAGGKGPYPTGKTFDSSQANFNGQFPYLTSKKGPYRRKTLSVGSFKPNAFGVHDMLGNAFEWTQDCWNDRHSGAPNDGSARKGGDCKYRVMKGGSWVSHAYQVRPAKRTKYTTNFRYDDYGFRIARTID